jgi:hypothetical protein
MDHRVQLSVDGLDPCDGGAGQLVWADLAGPYEIGLCGGVEPENVVHSRDVTD